jgi:hypothetical protein
MRMLRFANKVHRAFLCPVSESTIDTFRILRKSVLRVGLLEINPEKREDPATELVAATHGEPDVEADSLYISDVSSSSQDQIESSPPEVLCPASKFACLSRRSSWRISPHALHRNSVSSESWNLTNATGPGWAHWTGLIDGRRVAVSR